MTGSPLLLSESWLRAHNTLAEQRAASRSAWRCPRVDVLTFCREFLGRRHSPVQEGALTAIWGTDPAVFWPDTHRLYALCWGMGCLHPQTPIKDAESGETMPVAEWATLGRAPALRGYDLAGRITHRRAGVPFLKGRARLLRVTLADGRSCVVSDQHEFLVKDQMGRMVLRKAGQMARGDAVCVEGSNGEAA